MDNTPPAYAAKDSHTHFKEPDDSKGAPPPRFTQARRLSAVSVYSTKDPSLYPGEFNEASRNLQPSPPRPSPPSPCAPDPGMADFHKIVLAERRDASWRAWIIRTILCIIIVVLGIGVAVLSIRLANEESKEGTSSAPGLGVMETTTVTRFVSFDIGTGTETGVETYIKTVFETITAIPDARVYPSIAEPSHDHRPSGRRSSSEDTFSSSLAYSTRSPDPTTSRSDHSRASSPSSSGSEAEPPQPTASSRDASYSSTAYPTRSPESTTPRSRTSELYSSWLGSSDSDSSRSTASSKHNSHSSTAYSDPDRTTTQSRTSESSPVISSESNPSQQPSSVSSSLAMSSLAQSSLAQSHSTSSSLIMSSATTTSGPPLQSLCMPGCKMEDGGQTGLNISTHHGTESWRDGSDCNDAIVSALVNDPTWVRPWAGYSLNDPAWLLDAARKCFFECSFMITTCCEDGFDDSGTECRQTAARMA